MVVGGSEGGCPCTQESGNLFLGTLLSHVCLTTRIVGQDSGGVSFSGFRV